MSTRKYYHCSPVLFKPGDHVVPGGIVNKKNYNASDPARIYLTSDPSPHYTVMDRALEEDWYVYEVIPHGKFHIGSLWDDYVSSKGATVVKRLGNARGIARKTKKLTKKRTDSIREQRNRLKDRTLDKTEREQVKRIINSMIYVPSSVRKREKSGWSWPIR